MQEELGTVHPPGLSVTLHKQLFWPAEPQIRYYSRSEPASAVFQHSMAVSLSKSGCAVAFSLVRPKFFNAADSVSNSGEDFNLPAFLDRFAAKGGGNQISGVAQQHQDL